MVEAPLSRREFSRRRKAGATEAARQLQSGKALIAGYDLKKIFEDSGYPTGSESEESLKKYVTGAKEITGVAVRKTVYNEKAILTAKSLPIEETTFDIARRFIDATRRSRARLKRLEKGLVKEMLR